MSGQVQRLGNNIECYIIDSATVMCRSGDYELYLTRAGRVIRFFCFADEVYCTSQQTCNFRELCSHGRLLFLTAADTLSKLDVFVSLPSFYIEQSQHRGAKAVFRETFS